MARKRYLPEQFIGYLSEAEILKAKGSKTPQICKKINGTKRINFPLNGATEQTYYRWRKEYGGLIVNPAKRLKGVEKEIARLRRLGTDLSLDEAILKEVAERKY